MLKLYYLQVTEMKKEKTALVIPNAVQVDQYLCKYFVFELKSEYLDPSMV